MVNADTTTKEYSEQSERMRHLVVKSVLVLNSGTSQIYLKTKSKAGLKKRKPSAAKRMAFGIIPI